MNLVELIGLIKMFPALYDPLHPEYSDNSKTAHYWKQICNLLGEKESTVKSSWEILKNQYFENIVCKLNKDNLNETSSSKYDDCLSFLFPILENLIKDRYNEFNLINLYDQKNDLEDSNSISNNFDILEVTINKIDLIKLIEQNPQLYNIKLPKKDEYLIQPIWEHISKEMKTPVEVCKNVWNIIKRIYHKILTQKTENTKNRLSWAYEKHMSFAKEFIMEEAKTKDYIYNVKREDKSLSELLSGIPLAIEYISKVQDILDKLPDNHREIIEKRIDNIVLRVQDEYAKVKQKSSKVNVKSKRHIINDDNNDDDEVILLDSKPEIIEIESDNDDYSDDDIDVDNDNNDNQDNNYQNCNKNNDNFNENMGKNHNIDELINHTLDIDILDNMVVEEDNDIITGL